LSKTPYFIETQQLYFYLFNNWFYIYSGRGPETN
jgi:hypothetical protein